MDTTDALVRMMRDAGYDDGLIQYLHDPILAIRAAPDHFVGPYAADSRDRVETFLAALCALGAQPVVRVATLAERERCAKIAEDCDGPAPESDADGNMRQLDPRSAIAAAIRANPHRCHCGHDPCECE